MVILPPLSSPGYYRFLLEIMVSLSSRFVAVV